MFTPAQVKALSEKLHPDHVHTRKQSGRDLSYIEGWHAIAEANRIFGFDAWSRETIDIRCVSEKPRKMKSGDGFGVSYVARVRVIVDGVIREGVGAGHGIDADIGLAHESAIKEAETDAMKRALMTFGNPFGLALYDKTQANVGETIDYDQIAAQIMAGIDRSQTLEDLSDFWRMGDTKAAIRDLPEALRAGVERAKDKRKGELQKAAA